MTTHQQKNSDGCTLEVLLARKDASHLLLTYTFMNGVADLNAYLFNRIYSQFADGSFDTSPQRLYVFRERDAVIAAKRIIPIPANMRTRPVVPCTSRVEPGRRLREELLVPLPLGLCSPYSDPPAGVRHIELPLFFELGYFHAVPAGEGVVQMVQTPEGPVPYFDPFPVSSQKLLRVGPTSFTVGVLAG